MSNVFVSYSPKDRNAVAAIVTALQVAGQDVWTDSEGTVPSAVLGDEITAAIAGADSVIFVISPDSVSSEACAIELKHAVELSKRIVPVVIRDTAGAAVPAPLPDIDWAFVRQETFDADVARLVEALETDIERVHLHTRLFKHAGWHLFELARRPGLCDMLRRQPELIREFVEEVLRLEPMVPGWQRFTTQPTTVGGVELPANMVVMLCIGAVQRDGSDAMSTDDLVIGGRAHRHWSLGAGSMRCRGGHIVRQVLRVLVEEWVDRAGHVGLVPGFRPAAGFPATQSVLWLPELPLMTRA